MQSFVHFASLKVGMRLVGTIVFVTVLRFNFQHNFFSYWGPFEALETDCLADPCKCQSAKHELRGSGVKVLGCSLWIPAWNQTFFAMGNYFFPFSFVLWRCWGHWDESGRRLLTHCGKHSTRSSDVAFVGIQHSQSVHWPAFFVRVPSAPNWQMSFLQI